MDEGIKVIVNNTAMRTLTFERDAALSVDKVKTQW